MSASHQGLGISSGLALVGRFSLPRLIWVFIATVAFSGPIAFTLASRVHRDVPALFTPHGSYALTQERYADRVELPIEIPPLTRANLLSYLWTGSTSATLVWVAIGVIVLLVAIGAWVFPMDEVRTEPGERGRCARAAMLATFCFATGFSLAYALIVPPLQAVDETTHVASYAVLVGEARLIREVKDWAQATHFERIQGSRNERFRPADLYRPWLEPVELPIAPTVARSSLTARLWTSSGHFLSAMSARRVFGSIRLLHVLVFGTSVGLATGLLIGLTSAPYAQLLSFPWLAVPTLPFFGMLFGETALLASAAVLFTVPVVVLFLDGDKVHWAGLPLGVTSGAFLIGPRHATPMLTVVAALLLIRALLGSQHTSDARRRALVFWAGFGIGASSVAVGLGQSHLDRLISSAAQLPPVLGVPLGWVTRSWFPIAAAAVACFAEIAIGRWRSINWQAQSARLVMTTRFLPRAFALAITASLAGSLLWRYPTVEGMQRAVPPPLPDFLFQMVATGATWFRLRSPDFVVSESFWNAFGWLDTYPGSVIVDALVGLSSISLIGLLLHIASHQEVRRLLWLIGLGCALAVTLVAYAISGHAAGVRFSGRYLIAWHLAGIAVFWTYPAFAPHGLLSRLLASIGISRPAVFVGVWLAIHSYSLCFILRRYF